MATDKRINPDYDYAPHREADGFIESAQPQINRIKSLILQLAGIAQEYTQVIDISHWNTIRDWASLKEGIGGLVLRATYGATGVDNAFKENWQNAVSMDIPVMVYHFFRSNVGGAKQADHLWGNLQEFIQAAGYIPPVFADVETTDGVSNTTRISRLNGFLLAIKGKGAKAGIYTSPGFANNYLVPTPTWINDYYHWIAHWTPLALIRPNGWNSAQTVLWQYGIWDDHSWCDPVLGAQADIDRDKFFGTADDLRTFTGIKDPTMPDLEERVSALEESDAIQQAAIETLQTQYQQIQIDLEALQSRFEIAQNQISNNTREISMVKVELNIIKDKLDRIGKILQPPEA